LVYLKVAIVSNEKGKSHRVVKTRLCGRVLTLENII